MENFNTPTREDLHAYRVLINYLREVRSLLEGVNEETERSIELLREQKSMLEEQDCVIQDLSSNLNDCEDNVGHFYKVLTDKEELLASAMKVSNEHLTAMAAHRDSQREEAKFEQAAEAAEVGNG